MNDFQPLPILRITAVELFNTQAKRNKLRKKRAFPIWGKSRLNDT
ncbi:hypothetical protein SFy_2891 [Shigella flexneri 2003036]|nr:hypothetical protein SFy_2891 [Shigella flexneri 2003036]